MAPGAILRPFLEMCQKKFILFFFWSKTTKNPYQKNSKNFGREK